MTVRTFADFEWYGGEVITNVEKAKKTVLTMACIVINMDATPMAPVDTGNLRDSITYKVDGDEGRVGTNVEYAIHQEYGTKKMAAQSFLRPALDKNRSKLIREIGDFVGAAAEAGGRR